MNGSLVNLNCIGMQCPAPILAISKAAKAARRPSVIEVRADDGDFEKDVRAWCRSTGAKLESLENLQGTYLARIALEEAAGTTSATPPPIDRSIGPAPTPPPSPSLTPAPFPRSESPAARIDLDCRGMRAADILGHLSRVSRGTPRPSHVYVRASDPSFRRDFDAWCANNRGELFGFGAFEDHYLAIVGIHGATAPAEPFPAREPLSPVPPRQTSSSLGADDRAHPSRPEPYARPSGPSPAEFPRGTDSRPDLLRAGIVDLRGQRGEIALLQLGQRVIENGRAEFIGDDPMLGKHLRAWGQAIGAQVELHQDGATFRGLVRIDPRARSAPSLSPAPASAPSAAQPDGQPLRKNKATIMVLHNDFEPLVAALLTANACVAQGMEVELVFTFWGVNVLRAPVPRGPTPDEKPVPFMKRMMKWMMPAGPDAQQLSKMNMGGMGVEMMKYFMQKDNIMGVRQLMQQAADNGVKFTVCTMSMGVMGIQKSDLLPWPNIEFGGVVSFTSSARESAVSLVF